MLGTEAKELVAQANLLRKIFGSPFLPLSGDQFWLPPGVVKVAQTIYDNRAFDWMPGLADELEQAGCGSDEIMSHCRGPGPHVRGCWVLDMILRKRPRQGE